MKRRNVQSIPEVETGRVIKVESTKSAPFWALNNIQILKKTAKNKFRNIHCDEKDLISNE
jgi:hypothetical protein